MSAQIFFSCYTSCLMPLEEVAAYAAGCGFDGWEIVSEYKHSLHSEKARFLDVMRSYKFKYQIHAPLSDINIASTNERVRTTAVNEIIDTIKLAADFNVNIVTFHPGFISPLTFEDRKLALMNNRESLDKIDMAGREYSVTAAIENMPRMAITIGTTYEELADMIEGTELKICFDIGHANTAKSIDGFIRCKRPIANVHVHDNMGDRDEHLIPGRGNIDIAECLRKISKTGYRGNIVYEAKYLKDGELGRKSLLKMLDDAEI